MKQVKYIFLVILLASICACGEDFFETTLEIDPPEHIDQLVVHAFGNTRTNELKVLVSKSVGVLTDIYETNSLIYDAQIRLIKDDLLVHTLEPIDPYQYYNFNYIMPEGVHEFEKGANYKIEVEVDGYEMASSETAVPLDVNPISVDFEEEAGSDFEGFESSGINIKINDDPNKRDFYSTHAISLNDYYVEEYFNWIHTESFDPAVIEGLDNLILTDDTFDGKEKTIELLIDRIDSEFNPEYLDRLYLNWRVISEEQYLFNKTVNSFQENEDNPFSSPVQIFSNMNDGFGIFVIANETFIKVVP